METMIDLYVSYYSFSDIFYHAPEKKKCTLHSDLEHTELHTYTHAYTHTHA